MRFYAETAHDGVTDVGGGALQIGYWSERVYYEWTGIINDVTFEELGIDGMYVLTAESRYTALDRPISYTYLTSYIHVPEPSVLILFAMGLLLMLVHGIVRRRHGI